MSETTVTVIIPTTCDVRREASIFRALNSVQMQVGPTIDLVIVVNGANVDEGLYLRLCKTGARILRLAEGNVSKARFAGVQSINGEFFSFLDDDDEFLDDAMAYRLSLFSEGIDCVVTNGWEHDAQDQRLVRPEVARLANRDPAHAFLVQNWFASPGSMFRRATVQASVFDISHRFFEWTWLFFSLVAAGKTFKYDDAVTYRVWKDTPMSASRTMEYREASVGFLADLLKLPLEASVLSELRRKYQTALNSCSLMRLEERDRHGAWIAHVNCLKAGGWRYLPFTRKLLF